MNAMLTAIVTKKDIFPDYPKLAEKMGVALIRFLEYQVWENVFFVRIAGIGWRFISKKFTRTTVKVPCPKTRGKANQQRESNPLPSEICPLPSGFITLPLTTENKLYRVVRTYDRGSYYYGDRTQRVLIQEIGGDWGKSWDDILVAENVERDDVVKRVKGVLIKSEFSYAQAMGLY